MGGVIQSKSRVIYLVILFLVICFAAAVLFSRSAHAVEVINTFSWIATGQDVISK